MGMGINFLRGLVERITKENKLMLYTGGALITFIVVFLSGLSGWLIERLFLLFEIKNPISSTLLFAFFLSSALAYRSLKKSIFEIINLIHRKNTDTELDKIRKKLSFIVGRDVDNLNRDQILRATAETASENSVDGIFAPLFWMFIGTISWQFNTVMPGPLAMAWIFKASSTIDSMLGYKEGKLRWLGFTGAKLDDLMTWIPSRLVLLTLPFCCKPRQSILKTIIYSFKDGLNDSSPNSGISEAIFAYCANVRMGGKNYYNGIERMKPIIAKSSPIATIDSVKKILNLSFRLQIIWILGMLFIIKLINL